MLTYGTLPNAPVLVQEHILQDIYAVRDNLTLHSANLTPFPFFFLLHFQFYSLPVQCYTLLMLLLHFPNEDTRDTIGCKNENVFF